VTAADPAPTIGVDLGGTNLRVAMVDAGGVVLSEDHEPTPDDWQDLVAAGLVDREGTVHYAPNLPMLRNAPLGRALTDALSRPVVVDNDANVAASGELAHGAARGCEHALVITLGTGVGGSIIAGGRVYRGAHGFAAEVGHWQFDPDGARCACGEPGHWEAAASGTALGALARERAAGGVAPNVLARAGSDVAAVSGLHAGDSAQAGEPDGVAIIGDYARSVATGLAGLANILDPEKIVIAGGLIELGAVLIEPIRVEFDHRIEGPEFRPEIPVVAAELGERAGVIGAAALARTLVS
jgi:glucokinase